MTNPNTSPQSDPEHGRGAFLWSGMSPESDLPFWKRALLLPVYVFPHAYHCLRGTPVYVQYGNHELRYSDTEETNDD